MLLVIAFGCGCLKMLLLVGVLKWMDLIYDREDHYSFGSWICRELLDGQVRGHNLRFSVILGGIFQSPAIKGLNLHEVSLGREAFTIVANKNLK